MMKKCCDSGLWGVIVPAPLPFRQEADALYLRLDASPIAGSREVSPGVVLDYSDDDQVVGVEILRISQRAPQFDPGKLFFETTPPPAA